jgi:hypothetical protein
MEAIMIKVGTIVYLSSEKEQAKVVAIRIDSNGRPLLDLELLNGQEWVARFEEVSLA